MFQKLIEKWFGPWFRLDLYGVEDRLAEVIKKSSEQSATLSVVEDAEPRYDFPDMFATLEERIVKRVVAELGDRSLRVVSNRTSKAKASTPVDAQADSTTDEG